MWVLPVVRERADKILGTDTRETHQLSQNETSSKNQRYPDPGSRPVPMSGVLSEGPDSKSGSVKGGKSPQARPNVIHSYISKRKENNNKTEGFRFQNLVFVVLVPGDGYVQPFLISL